MKIKIAHLYYDLMNLYGENGNIRALKKALERQNLSVEVNFLTIGDNIDFNKYDIFYIGTGTERYQMLVLDDLMKYKEDIKNAINNNKYFFITGNAIELFGKYLVDFNGNKKEGLNIFNYYSKIIDIENYNDRLKFRITEETLQKSKFTDKIVIGFQNRCGTIHDADSPLFTMVKGCGNYPGETNEGYTYKNFYGSYTLGPLLMRNPYLTDYFIKKILKEKELKYKKIDKTSEIDAYNEFLTNFVEEKTEQ